MLGWRCFLTSHDLIPAYEDAYKRVGLYPFAPVPVVIPRPRLLGDGPASWVVHLMAARPKSRAAMRWRCLPGFYRSTVERNAPVVGAKRVTLCQEFVRDYSNPGDSIVDPCAGWGSTLIAAYRLGRVGKGCEKLASLAALASARVLASFDEEGEPTPESSKDKSPMIAEPEENECSTA